MFAASKTDGVVAGGTPDAQFNYVTMLLHGDGTNGAQNNTFVDSSTNNFTITRTGNTTQGSFSPYGSNWSNYFGGSSDWLTLPSNSAWTLGSTFTIEAWVNPAVFSANSKRICQADSGIDLSVNSSGYINFNAATTTTALSLNVWSHVAFVCNSGTSTLYINGVASGFTGTNTGVNVAGTSTLTVGTYQTNSGYAWQGYISNFRIVKSSAVYTSNFTPSTTPLTAITNTVLLTCQSNRFIDNSTNNFTISGAGSPSVQRFNPFGASTAYSTSVIGGSGYFDGSGDYLSTSGGTATAMGTGDFTWEVFVYVPAATTYQTFIETRSTPGPGANDGFFFGLSNGTLTPIIYTTSTLASSTKDITAGSWNHVAVTRSGTNLTFWINGVSGGTTTNSTNLSSQPVYIGNSTTTSVALTGFLSNVRMVKGTAVYTTAFTPPTAPLTAISGTSLLTNFINGAIFDNAMMNDLETVGNAQISTSVVKYGTGSIAFDGTGDYLDSGGSTVNFAFGTGNFTIEFWMYLNSTTQGHPIDFRPSGNNGAYPALYITSNTLIYFVNSANRITSSSLSTSTWYHVVICRSGTSTKMFINGTQDGSTYTDSTDYLCKTNGPRIGANDVGTGSVNGYIDDLRITKGYARYTSNFTPPTAAFPNTGPV